ncbi:DNA-binding protein [Caballeronia sp. INDeC2]|uniref:DNA-binding protein n=1 Tax=Caballeronia sp. INDeC2 TaxID=2921747 RepID=UPI002027FAE9|nr:DNA-binding protein [Caballeronia sp. INDeC2]
MNGQESQSDGSSIIVERLIQARVDKRRKHEVAEAVGWGVEMVEKVCAGSTGIPAEKVAALLTSLGLVVTTIEYMDYLARGNVIGSNCRCARMNMGECGRSGR